MRNEWSIEVTASGEGPGPSESSIEMLLDSLSDCSPAVGYSEGRYSVRFCVSASYCPEAVEVASEIFRKAVDSAGLPRWPIVHVEASTLEELERENLIPNYPALLGAKELADLLGVSKQRVWELRNMEGFPEPLAILASTPVWTEASVAHFLEEWERKPGRPRKAAAG